MKHGEKAAFVRKHADKTPAEVAELAEKAGLPMTAGYVSSVRSKDKASAAPAKKRKTSSKPAPKSGNPAARKDAIDQLKKMVIAGNIAKSALEVLGVG